MSEVIGEIEQKLAAYMRVRGYHIEGQRELVERVEADDNRTQLEDTDIATAERELFIAAPRLLRSALDVFREQEERINRLVGLHTDEEADKYRWLTRAEKAEAQLAAAQEEIASLKKGEKELSDAYLRIRSLLNAWDTAWGGVDRFEVTERAIRQLQERAERAEQSLQQARAHVADCFHCQQRGVCEELEQMIGLSSPSAATEERNGKA